MFFQVCLLGRFDFDQNSKLNMRSFSTAKKQIQIIIYVQHICVCVYVCVFPATSSWGVSKSWVDCVPTIDRDCSGPSLYCLLHVLFYPSCPACINRLYWFFHFILLSYRPVISSVCRRVPYILHPLPTSYPNAKCCLPGRCHHPSPTGLWRPTLSPAPCTYVCCCFMSLFDIHVPPLSYNHIHVSPLGFACHGSIHLPFASSSPLCVPLRILTSSDSWFLVRWTSSRKRERPGRLHSLAITRPCPHLPATWPCRRHSG